MSERYPGMKALAERVFSECDPRKQHDLTKEMKYFLQEAKRRGIATTMAWDHQTLHSLRALLGSPPLAETESLKNGNLLNSAASSPTFHPEKEKFASHFPMLSIASPSSVSPYRKVAQPIINSPIGNSPTKPRDPKQNEKRGRGDQLQAKRLERFQGKSAPAAPYQDQPIIGTVVGTNQELEKPFFRLTGQVNPAVVRPPEVIEKALPHVLAVYKQPNRGYPYITSQLQSIRQDLTVQHTENALTIKVYEVNARIALFHDDLGEFNKCMTRLTDLYTLNPTVASAKSEFQAYSVYYMLLRQKWDEISIVLQTVDVPDLVKRRKNSAVVRDSPTSLFFDENANLYPTKLPDQTKMLERALESVHWVQQEDLHQLMAVYTSAWHLEKKLMHRIVRRAQARALEGILVATKPQNQALPFTHVRNLLGVSKAQLKALLLEWQVPHTNKQIVSEEALPVMQTVSRGLAGFDIKGQI